MALAVYRFVLEQRSTNPKIQLYYTSRDGIVDLMDEALPKPLAISMENYFKVYGWNPTFKQAVDADLERLLELFLADMPTTHALLNKMRKYDHQMRNNPVPVVNLNEVSDSEQQLLQQLQTEGFIESLRITSQIASFRHKSVHHNRLVKGEWLEYLVFQVAKNQTLFDECAYNVSDRGQKGELDFVGAIKGQLIIASCKTGSKIEAGFLQELTARAAQLGREMCTKMFVTSHCPTERAQLEQYEKWAKEYQVIMVYGTDLARLKEKLQEALKGNRI
jgi:thiol-disulfide isomerase/thioredoxin